MIWLNLVLVGALAGVASGLFGIGGGLIIVPSLILLLKLPEHTAVATSLAAMLLPVGGLAVYNYYQAGKITSVHILYGLAVAAGLFVGALFGSKIALGLSQQVLRRSFAVFLVLVAARLWLKK